MQSFWVRLSCSAYLPADASQPGPEETTVMAKGTADVGDLSSTWAYGWQVGFDPNRYTSSIYKFPLIWLGSRCTHTK